MFKEINKQKTTVHDVVKYLTELNYFVYFNGKITTRKINKLLYYMQMHHILKYDQAIFREEISAWAAGPVVERIYGYGRFSDRLFAIWHKGNSSKLSVRQKETIEEVTKRFKNTDIKKLSTLTTLTEPYKIARSNRTWLAIEREEKTIKPKYFYKEKNYLC